MRRGQVLAQLAGCALAYAASELQKQHSDLVLRLMAGGLDAAALEMESSVEAAASAVSQAAKQLLGAEPASPLVASGTLQRLLLAPDQPGKPSDVKVGARA